MNADATRARATAPEVSALAPVELDHLVVAARTLAEGAAWCSATLGVDAQPGGRHALMGTHNLLLGIGSGRYPRSYLEIIAIDPQAPPPTRPRWFGLDGAALQQRLAAGPCLVHWVARSPSIEAQVALLRMRGHDPGVLTAAERTTPHGLLRWRITLPADGSCPAGGAVPLLIEWAEGAHPCDALPESGVVLQGLALGGLAADLEAALRVGGTEEPVPGLASLRARLATPNGCIVLATPSPSGIAPAPGDYG